MIKNLVYSAVVIPVALAGLYLSLPSAYGHLAYTVGLPVNDRVNRAVPEEYLAYQAERLAEAEQGYEKGRHTLREQKVRVQAAIAANQEPLGTTRYWLQQARDLFRNNSTAESYELAGRSYSKAEFGTQVELLHQQLTAYEQADKQLQASAARLSNLEMQLVSARSTIAANKVRLQSARVTWETQRVLDAFEVDIDLPVELEEAISSSDYVLRSAEELSRDQGRVAPQDANAPGLSANALAILSAG